MEEGARVVFVCESNVDASEEVHYGWIFTPRDMAINRTIALLRSFVLPEVLATEAGTYTCRATARAGSHVVEKSVSLDVVAAGTFNRVASRQAGILDDNTEVIVLSVVLSVALCTILCVAVKYFIQKRRRAVIMVKEYTEESGVD